MTECAECGQGNPDGARFCNLCGAPLAAGTAAAREVRKTVTVLFCDVVGSTALAERSDPEVMRGVMARFYAAVRAPVERHGGTVEKVIGDALMAVFGIPTVHEDDALRALRAALEMRDAVREMGEIQARIGVNTGDVLARDPTQGESLVVGDAVNVAARLEQAAEPGRCSSARRPGPSSGTPPAASRWRRLPRRASGSRSPPGGSKVSIPRLGDSAAVSTCQWSAAMPSSTSCAGRSTGRAGLSGRTSSRWSGSRGSGSRGSSRSWAAWVTGSPCSPVSVVR